jgi:hypothetical protein
MTPITDEERLLEAFAPAKPVSGGEGGSVYPDQRSPVRMELLDSVLPAPELPEDEAARLQAVAEIARFKERYSDDLRAFRRKLEERVLILCAFDDEQQRRIAAREEAVALREEVEEIAARMREHRWRELAWAGVAVVGAAAGAATALTEPQAAPAVAGLAGFALAARQLHAVAQHGAGREPLAYAVLAQRRFAATS